MGSPRRRGHRHGQAGATAAASHGRPPVVRVVDDRPPACPGGRTAAAPDVWRLDERRGDTVVAVPESPRLPWRAVALSTALALAAATATYVVLSDDDDAATTATSPSAASS